MKREEMEARLKALGSKGIVGTNSNELIIYLLLAEFDRLAAENQNMGKRGAELSSWLDKICEPAKGYNLKDLVSTVKELGLYDTPKIIEAIADYLDSQKGSKPDDGSIHWESKYYPCADKDCPICNPKPKTWANLKRAVFYSGDEDFGDVRSVKYSYKCPECGGTRQKKVYYWTKWAQDMNGTRGFLFRHTPDYEYFAYEPCPSCKGKSWGKL